jgi:hypothetical protein
VLLLLHLVGCANDSDVAPGAVGRYGLEKKELIAAKKAGISPANLRKAEMERKIEQMKEQGITVETGTSTKKSRRR